MEPCSHKQLVHKHLRGPVAEYQGYPALLRYSGFYNGKRVPGVETLQARQAQLERYLAAKQLELDQVTDEKKQLRERDALSPTLRMIFRRAETELNHDIKELKDERDMVRDAATAQAERLMRY